MHNEPTNDLWRKLGCGAAALIFLIVAFPFFFAMAWSGAHCEPAPQCQRANELHFGAIIAGVAALAGLIGFLIARLLTTLAMRREDEGTSAGFFALAIFGTLVAAVFVMLVAYAFLDWASS